VLVTNGVPYASAGTAAVSTGRAAEIAASAFDHGAWINVVGDRGFSDIQAVHIDDNLPPIPVRNRYSSPGGSAWRADLAPLVAAITGSSQDEVYASQCLRANDAIIEAAARRLAALAALEADDPRRSAIERQLAVLGTYIRPSSGPAGSPSLRSRARVLDVVDAAGDVTVAEIAGELLKHSGAVVVDPARSAGNGADDLTNQLAICASENRGSGGVPSFSVVRVVSSADDPTVRAERTASILHTVSHLTSGAEIMIVDRPGEEVGAMVAQCWVRGSTGRHVSVITPGALTDSARRSYTLPGDPLKPTATTRDVGDNSLTHMVGTSNPLSVPDWIVACHPVATEARRAADERRAHRDWSWGDVQRRTAPPPPVPAPTKPSR